MVFGVSVDVVCVKIVAAFAEVMPTRKAVFAFADVTQFGHWLDEVVYGRNFCDHQQNINGWLGLDAGYCRAADVMNGDKDGLKDGR